jgi:ATP/maltotriose-dependent transcriptional regulator MalT
MHFPQLEGWLTMFQAQAHLLRGDHARAATVVAHGRQLVQGIHFAPAVVTAQAIEAALAYHRGEPAVARRLLTDALALAEQSGARYATARVHLALANLAADQGDAAELARHREQAHTLFVEMGAPVWAARASALSRAASA